MTGVMHNRWKEEIKMVRRTGLHLVLAALVTAIPFGNSQAASPIEGVWLCLTTRPGSTATNIPTYYTFHTDGTVAYSSGTSLSTLGFFGRGSGYGEWRKIGTNEWAVKTAELLHNLTGQLAGRLFVDARLVRDPVTDRLCSGPSCPSQTSNIKITSITLGSDGGVSSEIDLVPWSVRFYSCERLGVSFPATP
jgi:hypothetical protein